MRIGDLAAKDERRQAADRRLRGERRGGGDRRVAQERAALERGAPVVYEATFAADGVTVVADILERRPGAGGFAVVEVKASTRAKPEHVPDLAVQVHVLRRSGLTVERAEVMHLNSQCRFPDLTNLFAREDVTARVESYLLGVPDEIAAQLAMLRGPLPDVAIGDHCTKPYDCPFLERCWSVLPPHHLWTLYRIRPGKVAEYEALGYETIHDLPSELELGVIHARQVQAVTTGRIVVEPALGPALAEFRSPLAFLDFETVSRAIPMWGGVPPVAGTSRCSSAVTWRTGAGSRTTPGSRRVRATRGPRSPKRWWRRAAGPAGS